MKHPRYFKIPYSSHSSPQELEEFVQRLDPEHLVFNLTEKPDSHRNEWQMRVRSKFTKQGRKEV